MFRIKWRNAERCIVNSTRSRRLIDAKHHAINTSTMPYLLTILDIANSRRACSISVRSDGIARIAVSIVESSIKTVYQMGEG